MISLGFALHCVELGRVLTGTHIVLSVQKTSVIIDDPEQPCCKKCVQVKNPCRPVREDTVRLNFTDPDRSGGVCVSEPVDIQRCKGSCSDSFMSTKYVYVTPLSFIP